jgi:hypothetical protein
VPSPGLIFGAIGRTFLFAAACGVLCLIVAEVALGYNLYFQSGTVWFATCYVPAMLGGLMYLVCTARGWVRRSVTRPPGT